MSDSTADGNLIGDASTSSRRSLNYDRQDSRRTDNAEAEPSVSHSPEPRSRSDESEEFMQPSQMSEESRSQTNDAETAFQETPPPRIDEAEEERLDYELFLIRRMRLAFESSLHMLEAARDDLVELGARMDRLQRASQLCRQALQEKKERERVRR